MVHSPPATAAVPPHRAARASSGVSAALRARSPDPRSAERDLWFLLLVTCAVPLTGSLLDFARLCGAPVHAWSAAVLPWLRLLCSLAAGWWLVTLVRARPSRWGAVRRGAAPALAAVAVTGRVAALVWPGGTWGVVGSLATTASLAWLCGESAVRHGVGWRGLGVAPHGARTAAGRLMAVAVFGAVVVLASTTVTWMARLRLGLPETAPWLPVLDRAQSAALGWNGPADMVANVLFTGVAEEMVLVGAVVVLGRAARRPLWVLCALSLLLRVAAHLYLGVPGVALVLLGACALLVYLRSGRLTPLVAGHVAYDLAASLVPSPEALGSLVLAALICAGAAFVVWFGRFAPAAGAEGRAESGRARDDGARRV
ncbi:CPBP family intramembrane metalloprotease [Streptomyces sp. TRM43335]|uniref:CPBP family intramembrane metalloprotease n=1 Tax=Streptomyces taklimakanensis TaxID=2569853 RepID=A0A6G2B7I2_9ACTN|nr:CPBP family glutamic-type intramembrane protease [Streptomyces taklimakanensis]MTE18033.1 CPBP family intramembrane metalloprotease [Streptomyces taklimakanensis]